MTSAPETAPSPERAYVQDHRDDLLADLDRWLRIPGISAQPEHHGDVRDSADWLVAALRRTGFPVAEVIEGPWLPAVYAEWPSDDPDAPTVLVYGHHDVQPVDPVELWHTDPFDPTLDGDVLRARGASDDKGQLLFHLLGVRAHLAATGRTSPAVNLKFLVEGEEESGSPHFEELLESLRERIGCDVVVVTDTGIVAPDVPSTVTGMRGMVSATVTLHGPGIDLHSGVFGGAVPNPATALARLVAALHDDDGRVQVPGFYDDVLELTDAERELFARVPADDDEFLAVAQSRALHGEAGFTTLERIGARPTAEVNGIGGGYQGAGHKTIVPTHAFAKLSFRLVADQDPKKIVDGVESFVAAHTADRHRGRTGVGRRRRPPVSCTARYTCVHRVDGCHQRRLRRCRRAAHPGGRQRSGGGVAGGHRCPAGVPRFHAAGRPDPRAEREGVRATALQGCRGRRAPLVGVRPNRRPGAQGGLTG